MRTAYTPMFRLLWTILRSFAPQRWYVVAIGRNLGLEAGSTTRQWNFRKQMRLARFIGNFQGLWAVRVTNSNLRIREGISKLWGVYPRFPKILSAPSGKTIRLVRRSFGGSRMVRNSSVTMPSMVGLAVRVKPKREKVRCFCPSRFWTVTFMLRTSLIRRLNTEPLLIPLDMRGLWLCSAFSCNTAPLDDASTEYWSWNAVKFEDYCPSIINRFMQFGM